MQEIQKTTCFKTTLEKLPWISGRDDEGLVLLPPSLLQKGIFKGIFLEFAENFYRTFFSLGKN